MEATGADRRGRSTAARLAARSGRARAVVLLPPGVGTRELDTPRPACSVKRLHPQFTPKCKHRAAVRGVRPGCTRNTRILKCPRVRSGGRSSSSSRRISYAPSHLCALSDLTPYLWSHPVCRHPVGRSGSIGQELAARPVYQLLRGFNRTGSGLRPTRFKSANVDLQSALHPRVRTPSNQWSLGSRCQ